MLKKIPFRYAVIMMMALLSALLLYHLLIISGVISFQVVWGGRVQTKADMYRMEGISIIINLAMLMVVAIKGRLIKKVRPGKVITVLLWIMFASYVLNTIGNILSTNSIEAAVFTPLTILAALMCLRLAVE